MAAILLALVSAFLLVVWFIGGLHASKLIGIESEIGNMADLLSVSRRAGLAALFLQFVVTWLTGPVVRVSQSKVTSIVRGEEGIVQGRRWQNYAATLVVWIFCTVVIAFIFFLTFGHRLWVDS